MALPFQDPNDPAEIKGATGPIEQAPEFLYVQGQGYTTFKSFEGATVAGIVGMMEELRLAGYTNIRVRKVNGVWTVNGEIAGLGGQEPGEESVEDSWTIRYLSESADTSTHPVFQAVSDNELRKVLEAIKNPVAGTAPALTEPAAIDLYTLLLRKWDSFVYHRPVLEHTQSPVIGTPGVNGYDKVWTAAQIGVPVQPVAAMVAAYYVGTIPFTNPPPEFNWGWLKMPVTVTADVNGRSQMQEEWILGLWPERMFSTY